MGKNLGHGRNSTVRLGVHIDLGLLVAVKITKRKNLTEKHLYETLREADILHWLNHPNIVAFIDLYVEPRHIALVTDSQHMNAR